MSKLIKEAKNFCENLLSNSICSKYHFHNLQHTIEVYKSVQLIADSEKVTSEETEVAEISALFHDTGYSQIYKGHEKISMHIAEEFLTSRNYTGIDLSSVLKCIAATRMPQKPIGIIEKIICDADLSHLSAPNYLQSIALLRKEWSYFLNMNFSNEEWQSLSIEFLKSHKYHTHFGNTILEEYKMKNLELLEQHLVPRN